MPKPFLFILCLCLQLSVYGQNLKDSLDHQYKNHILALRLPFTPGDQEFDTSGKSLNPPPQDKWLLYGSIFVENLELSSDTLVLSCHLAGIGRTSQSDKPVAIALGKPMKVKIHLEHPLVSVDEGQAVLDHIFYPESDHLHHARPEWLRSDVLSPEDRIYPMKDVNPMPKPVYTPQAPLSKEAREAKFQGNVLLTVVVDKSGDVRAIRLDQAIGLGLDELAMERVKTWHFEPGKHKGEPVPVEMKVEVSFNRY